MAMDLAALPEPVTVPGLEIRRVRDEDDFEQYLGIVVAAMELPPSFVEAMRRVAGALGLGADAAVQHYLGLLDGRPVSTSAVILAGGTAGIYNVGTLEGHRGRGIGAALTLAPLYDARARRHRIGTLQSSPLAYSLYERIGFREVTGFTPYRPA